MRKTHSILTALAILALGWSRPAGAAAFPAAWKNVQTVTVNKTGLIKLSVPLETLDAARPALEDLRLFDDAGREVPFLVERPVPASRAVRSARNFQAALTAETTIATFETGLAPALDGVTLETPARSFLKAVLLEGSPDGQNWQVIKLGQPIFRQSDGASQLHLSFPPAVWAWLRVTLDDRRSAPIPLTGAEVFAAAPEPLPSEPMEVKIVDRDESPGQTRLTLLAAGRQVTLAGLEIATAEPLFTRPVSLAWRNLVENEVREITLARGTIYRVAVEGQPAVANLVFAAETVIPMRELILTIYHGDSPPLPVTIQARRRPVYVGWLASQAGAYHLLTGNPDCPAPRYDLASLRNLSATLVAPPQVSPLHPNPAWRLGTPLPEIQEIGTAIDLAKWGFRKRVALEKAGVQQLELDLETLSRASGGFGDLRLVRDGKQLPYLLERTSFQRAFAPAVENAHDPKRPTVSRWKLRLPQASLPVTQLTCEADAPFFKRDARLSEQVPDERGNLQWVQRGSAAWVRGLNDPKGKLSLPLYGSLVGDQLVLEIDNGDNPPLELKNLQLFYPVTRLIFKVSAGSDTWLYYGNREANAPSYDLDLVARQLLAAEKSKALLRPAEPLKKTGWPQSERLTGSTNWLFWTALVGVVAGLLFVIARLLPKPPGK
jgi:hypothetical protein